MLCNTENKVKMFRLPQNPEKKRWITLIPRDDISDSKDAIICERHWPKDYPTIIDYGKFTL